MTHPAVRSLLESPSRHPAFQELIHHLQRPGRRGSAEPPSLSGLSTTAKCLYLVLLWQAMERPLLVIVDGNKEAENLLEGVEAFFDLLAPAHEASRPQILPAFDVLPHQNLSPHSEIAEQRAIAFWRLANQASAITIAPVAAALLRTEHRDFYKQLPLTLRAGEELPPDLVISHLQSIGYEPRDPVEMVGEYSTRGGILDIFPAESQDPVRIEFFGDEIESMRRFDVNTQRSVQQIRETQILPLIEHPKSRALFHELTAKATERNLIPGQEFPGWEYWVAAVRPRTHSLLDAAAEAVIVWNEPEQIASAAERLFNRLESPEKSQPSPLPVGVNFFEYQELRAASQSRLTVYLRELDVTSAGSGPALHIGTRPSTTFHGNMPRLVGESRTTTEAGGRVVLFAPSIGEVERIASILQEYSVPFQLGIDTSEPTPEYLAERAYMAGATGGVYLVKACIRHGVVFSDEQLAMFGSEDLFDTSNLVAPANLNRRAAAAFQADIADLKEGDYVVHTQHGVARFIGIRSIAQGELTGDFMLLEYAGESRLYVPLTRLDLVQKFRGAGEGAAPPLDRMGGTTWAKTKSRVKARMRDMADELLKLYAQRKVSVGFAFSPDSNWQREFEDAFEYTATKDQVAAVRQIKRDMEGDQPMDRLLCGDVGFGKTEVAMRSAFKALGDGKQVAVLAPTTVLTLQHYESFKRRFAPFPVRIEMLSRFRTSKEIKASLEEIAAGKIDITIGTHRLLSKDVVFHDLGLLIVDEEQRFGVRHKERLKEMKKNVDVLTMSATPIPRTLHMSLLGLRDMSIIETPPKDRIAIQTVVAHFDQELIKNAIEQELSRGGQVYFVHNRVETIFRRAAAIQELIPDVKIGVGHGQMGEAELEKALLGFMKHEYDVFVCTTIVENGLDIPLANTIIIENAERYGLSELYQLRGRVGRSNRRAYAYLLVPADTELSEIARKRLAALKEFSDLGAGFKIAALDLELRGAGNLLGGEQHGHMESVGLDTYIRLLEETVLELKGEVVPVEIHASINLGLEVRIPSEYIADEHQRLRAYKRIAEARNDEDAAVISEELRDRYGAPPAVVRTLLQFAVAKSAAERAGVEAIDRRGNMLNIKFHSESRIEPQKLLDIVTQIEGAQFTPAGVLRLPTTGLDTPGKLLGYLAQLFTTEITAPAARIVQ